MYDQSSNYSAVPSTVMSSLSPTLPTTLSTLKKKKGQLLEHLRILNMTYEYKYESCYLRSSRLFEILAFSVLKA